MAKNIFSIEACREAQQKVKQYMVFNSLSFKCNNICEFQTSVVCELKTSMTSLKYDMTVVYVDENTPMKIQIPNAWNANDGPTEYIYGYQKFIFDSTTGLMIKGVHPIHGDYKTTIYNL